jgi:hypothetical protein
VLPHDVESFPGSTFCLFVMVQPWNIGVCWIDEVSVTEFSPQKLWKHERQNISFTESMALYRIINVYFYQIKCCFYTQNGCVNKKILQQLIPSHIPDRFSKLLCSTAVSFPYLWRHSSMTSKYVSRHISWIGCLMKENTVLNF